MADLVNVGINYPVDGVEKRAEAGDVVDDIPEASRGWLIEQGIITPAVAAGNYANGEELEAAIDEAVRPSRKRGK